MSHIIEVVLVALMFIHSVKSLWREFLTIKERDLAMRLYMKRIIAPPVICRIVTCVHRCVPVIYYGTNLFRILIE